MGHLPFNLCDGLEVFGPTRPVAELGIPLCDREAVVAEECLPGDQIDPGIEPLARKGMAERVHREPPLQPCALGIRPEMALDPAMIQRSPTAVVEELGRVRRPPARKPAPQRLLGIGTEVHHAAPPVFVPLTNNELLGLELDVLSLQRHQFTEPNAAA